MTYSTASFSRALRFSGAEDGALELRPSAGLHKTARKPSHAGNGCGLSEPEPYIAKRQRPRLEASVASARYFPATAALDTRAMRLLAKLLHPRVNLGPSNGYSAPGSCSM